MSNKTPNTALKLADDLVAAGMVFFTFDEAMRHLGRSPSATANLLRRMIDAGLIDRVRRGRYVVRDLGVLGTRAAVEDVALAVGGLSEDRQTEIVDLLGERGDSLALPHIIPQLKSRIIFSSGRRTKYFFCDIW